MREISFIAVHCSASDNKKDDCYFALKDLHTLPSSKVIEWGHYKVNPRNWKKIGYHYFITKDGIIFSCRDESEVGAHIRGHNKNSIGICLSGNSEFTKEQKISFRYLADKLMKKYNLGLIDLVGHGELDSKKTCPNFNVIDFYSCN